MDIHIQIGKLNVLRVDNSSGIFSGEIYQFHRSAMAKSNIGLALSGKANFIYNCVNMVNTHRVHLPDNTVENLQNNGEYRDDFGSKITGRIVETSKKAEELLINSKNSN